MNPDHVPRPKIVGRASTTNPPNRFERVRVEPDSSHSEYDEQPAAPRRVPTLLLPDASRRVICRNDSPDIPFRWSINPYRGCEHGCAYCYARPGHEMLGLNAGLDFETKIVVKHDAAGLLRDELGRPSWRGEVIALSGATDCYQPAERRLGITRSILEVMLDARQPVRITTKTSLVARDLDLLAPMARMNLVQVMVTVTTLDKAKARAIEPRTAAPEGRLRAIRRLSEAGVPVAVLVAPVIPGLNDHEMPGVLRAAKDAGAVSAGHQLLRLPLSVAPIFTDWLAVHFPLEKDRVLQLVRDTHGGRLNEAEFGRRMTGRGAYAEGVHETFEVFARKFGLDRPLPPLDSSKFRRPCSREGQRRLF